MITRDLMGTKLFITQNKGQSFNLDTVLLADFIKVPYKCKTIYDFGTGNGALMLYLSQKSTAKIIGIEIQEHRYQMALHNIILNKLEDRLEVIHQDIKLFKKEGFADIVVSNPPFFKVVNEQKQNMDLDQKIARHEIMITLESLVESMSLMLNHGGFAYLIHRPQRLDEIFSICEQYKLRVKRIRMIHPYINQAANHVLIEAVKGGKQQVLIEPPLILYQAKHQYTEELTEIYGGRSYAASNTR